MLVVDKVRDDVIDMDEASKSESKKLVTSAKSSQNSSIEKGKEKVEEPIVKTIP